VFLAQQELYSSTRTLESQDTTLGILTGAGIALGLWLLDHLESTGSLKRLGLLLGSIFAVIGTLAALIGLLFLTSETKLNIRLAEHDLAANERVGLLKLSESIARLANARADTEVLKRLAQRLAFAALGLAAIASLEPWW
jgi:hypothetical protein